MEYALSTGDKLVYSDDPCSWISERMKQYGSAERLMIVMFDGRPYKTARDWSVLYAKCFKMTPVEFMRCWKKLRFVAAQERVKASSKDSAAEIRSSSEEASRRSEGISSSE